MALEGLPWVTPPLPPDVRSHPTVMATWTATRLTFTPRGLSPSPSPLLPILGNPHFPPGVHDSALPPLREAGMTSASHFLCRSRWMSSLQISACAGLTTLQILQISHFLRSLPEASGFARDLTSFEKECLRRSPLRHTLSYAYRELLDQASQGKLHFLDTWEQDLGTPLPDKARQRLITFSFSSSISCRIQEMGYKLLTRWYYTPARLHEIFPNVSPLCWRCGKEQGTLLHIFWSCPDLSHFWRQVHSITQKFLDTKIPLDPGFFLLHHNTLPTRTYSRSVVRHLVNAARACVPIRWKSSSPPTVSQWLRNVEETRIMEDLTSSLRGTGQRYRDCWFYWLSFIQTQEYNMLLGLPEPSTLRTLGGAPGPAPPTPGLGGPPGAPCPT